MLRGDAARQTAIDKTQPETCSDKVSGAAGAEPARPWLLVDYSTDFCPESDENRQSWRGPARDDENEVGGAEPEESEDRTA